MLTGIDVSHHNGIINWQSVEDNTTSFGPIDFAWVKRTEGTDFVDNQSSRNIDEALKHVPVVGTYHFLREDNPRTQAEHYFKYVEPWLDKTLCAVDVEYEAPDSYPSDVTAHMFSQRFDELSGGHHLFIYTGRWYWQGILGNPYGADLGLLWHSSYTTNPGAVYGGWERITIWQYSNRGMVTGIPTQVDLNHFYGSIVDLAQYTKTRHETAATATTIYGEEHDMSLIVVNQQTKAALHVIGERTVLIDNSEDLKDFMRAGIPVVAVQPHQFQRYVNLREDVPQ